MPCFDKKFFAFAILLYTSCAEENANSIVDSSPVDSPVTQLPLNDTAAEVTASVADSVQRNYPLLLLNWEKELQGRGVKFNLDNFYASSQHDMSFANWNPLFMDYTFGRSYSSDSSYSTYTEPGWAGGQPDTYLYLIDEKKKREITLEVWGTCSSFENSDFANDSVLVTYGYEDCSTEIDYPNQNLYAGFYAYYNLHTMVATYYSSKNFFNPKLGRR